MNKSLQGKVEYAHKLEGLEEKTGLIWEIIKIYIRNIPYRNYRIAY